MFTVDARPARQHLVVAPAGELDFFTAPALRDAVRHARDEGWNDLVLDLRGVTFMDSAGAHLMLDLRQEAAGGLRCSMVDPPRPVRRVLELVKLPQVLPRIDLHDLPA